MSRPTRYLVLLVLLLPVAACGSRGPGAGGAAPSPTQASAPAPAPELHTFYVQRLQWRGCASWECAALEVPLDYSKPAGKIARLVVLRQKASRPDQRIGSLVINPGGPGGSGVEAAAEVAEQVRNSAVGQRFDIVGFDPRGIGYSEPAIKCYTPPEQDADRLEVDLDTSPAGVARRENDTRDYVAKCVQRSGADLLANLGTRDVARDMDILRAALGDQKLTFIGYSYGTRLGYTYAEAFPQNVRALVLDGAVDPDQSEIDSTLAQAAGFQKAFDAFAGWCAQRPQCPLGTDPKAATGAYQKLVRSIVDKPVPLAGGRRLSYSDAVSGTLQALYSDQRWESLRTGLSELAGGHGEGLMKLADEMQGRLDDGTYDRSDDVLTAVRCVDERPLVDPAALLELGKRYIAVAPFLDDGHGPSTARGSCAFWPVPNTSEPHQPKVAGLPRTLVVSTTGDPATPYAAGVNLAKTLNAGLLTVQGAQHTAALEGNQCVDDIVARYLTDLQVPPDGASCALTPS
jgi:pimeloyl-ACP methyl ester carboxylesterase